MSSIAGQRSEYGPCRNCSLREWCDGGCIGKKSSTPTVNRHFVAKEDDISHFAEGEMATTTDGRELMVDRVVREHGYGDLDWEILYYAGGEFWVHRDGKLKKGN